MNVFQEMLQRLNVLFNRVTDWLLIVIGTALIAKASLAVDIPWARYVIIGIGAALVGIGFWYRYRRKQRHR